MGDTTRKWLIRGVIAVVAVVGLGYGAIFLYTEVINGSPDELDEQDLRDAVNATDQARDPVTIATSDAADTTTSDESAVDGDWTVASGSVVRYRVDEVLAGVNTTAVGETDAITGSLSVDGTAATAAEFSVDVATFESDRSQRDGQFRGRIMDTEQFPEATFALAEPIELGAVPSAGEQLAATATGELTMHGVTNPVTFDVTAEAGKARIGVLGSIPITFADYGIENPSFGTVKTEDDGSIEFVLVFERA